MVKKTEEESTTKSASTAKKTSPKAAAKKPTAKASESPTTKTPAKKASTKTPKTPVSSPQSATQLVFAGPDPELFQKLAEQSETPERQVRKRTRQRGESSGEKTAAKKTQKKSSANKATKGLSEEVLGLIEDSTNGLKTDQIIEQTGLSKRQIWGIVSRAKKSGKIRTAKRGIYLAS